MTVEGSGLLAAAVESVFASPVVANAEEHFARSGYCTLRLQFASARLKDLFWPSFIPKDRDDEDMSLVFAGASDIDLSHLIPEPCDRARALVTDSEYAIWQPGHLDTRLPGDHDILSILDFRSRRGLVWLRNDNAPAWYATKPAMLLLHAMAKDTAWSAVHGGCVGLGDRCLLLAGHGKAGKTTATLACAMSGWNYAGDDFVLANAATSRVEPLYATARLRTAIATEFSALLPAEVDRSEEDNDPRHELRLRSVIGKERFCGGQIAAILLPRRRGAESITFTPARRIDAFSALLPSTSMSLLGWQDKTTKKVGALVERAPIFFVDTGNRPSDIPGAFSRFLDELR